MVQPEMHTMNESELLVELTRIIEQRRQQSPDESYVAKLHHKGQDAILKKIGEEATELVMASKDQDAAKVVAESADLLFHNMVLLSHHGLSMAQVLDELKRRMGVSGLVEKASRK